MPLADATRTIVRGLLEAALDEVPRVLRGDDVEAVHDARVEVRRLRTALRKLSQAPRTRRGSPRAAIPARPQARRIRDADVHLAALRGALGGATVDESAGIQLLLESMAAGRRRALADFAVEMSQFDSSGLHYGLERAVRTTRSSKSLADTPGDSIRKAPSSRPPERAIAWSARIRTSAARAARRAQKACDTTFEFARRSSRKRKRARR